MFDSKSGPALTFLRRFVLVSTSVSLMPSAHEAASSLGRLKQQQQQQHQQQQQQQRLCFPAVMNLIDVLI